MRLRQCSSRRLLATATCVMGVLVAGLPAGAMNDLGIAVGSGEIADQLLVKFRPGTPSQDRQAGVAAAGGRKVAEVFALGVDVVRSDNPRALENLRRNPNVEYAEYDGTATGAATPNDWYWASQWGPQKVNAASAWDTTTGSATVTIAVLDSGVDYNHPDLSGKLLAGYDFINNDADATDDHGHGTSVAGIAAATTNNSVGTAGMCWACKVLPVKVLDANNWGTWSAISSGITYAANQGARVINLSLLGSSASTTLHDAVRYAHDKGSVIVAAAGNSATTTLQFPAAFPEVIGVAATDPYDTRYSWSNYGSWVDVAAPGVNYTTRRGGSYEWFTGTSGATPIVAGIAGLAFSHQPAATNDDVRNAINVGSTSVGTFVGYGRVDARGALGALRVTAAAPAPSPSPSPSGSPSPAPSPSASPSPSPMPTVVSSPSPSSAPSPTPAPTSAPSPDPSPAPVPTSEPTAPATDAAPTLTTTTVADRLVGNNRTRSYPVTTMGGELRATVTWTQGAVSSLELRDSVNQVVASGTGANPLTLNATVPAGAYTVVVAGSHRTQFSLDIQSPV